MQVRGAPMALEADARVAISAVLSVCYEPRMAILNQSSRPSTRGIRTRWVRRAQTMGLEICQAPITGGRHRHPAVAAEPAETAQSLQHCLTGAD